MLVFSTKPIQTHCRYLSCYLANIKLVDFNVTFLSLICALQSQVYAYFNVGFQPCIVAYERRMNIDHTSYITTAEDIGYYISFLSVFLISLGKISATTSCDSLLRSKSENE